jgi:F-type H+-transporting ATPase subunit epsilon
MREVFKMKIITPEEELLNEEASSATLPGSEGEFGVLPDHSHLVAKLSQGLIVVEGNANRKYVVSAGVAQVKFHECKVLVDDAIELNSSSTKKLEEDIDNINVLLSKKIPEEQKQHLKTKLDFLQYAKSYCS